MCSNADIENDGVMLMEKLEEPNMIGKYCRKCVNKSQASVVLRKKDAYCKSCFLASVTHKFRACLGKSKTMRPGDKVVIGFSGSVSSVALLHLIQNGLQDTSHKKLMFDPYIIHVDESSALNLTIEEHSNIIKNINGIMKIYGYPAYTVPLDFCTKSDGAMASYLAGESRLVEDSSLKSLFSNLSDVNSRMDMLCKLRYNVLVQAANALDCKKVFTAETADDLAMKLFTNVSLGRGAQLPYDIGFSDERFQDVKVMRPLRDLSKKEIVFYSTFHRLSCVHVPSLLTKMDANSSIHRLTEAFLSDLQEGFPSTMPTVFRVADKLTTNSEGRKTCPLCKAPVDTDDVASSSLSATHFSRLVSSAGPSRFDMVNFVKINSDSNCCGQKENSSNETCHSNASCSSKTTVKDLQEILCYGCSLIIKYMDRDKIPPQIMRHIWESTQRLQMKKEIEDFLL